MPSCQCKGSPTGVFVGLSAAELFQLWANGLAGITGGGLFTQLSGAAKSSTKEIQMSSQEIIKEAKFALGKLGYRNLAGPPQTIYQNYQGLRPMPGTVTVNSIP